jgi:(p)ppGpp synthase/HD superfamily hydrolase
MDIVERARVFATAAHAAVGQLRKYTNEPYIVHPKQVAQFVETAGGTPEMIAAAWLHDVVEDCGVSVRDLIHLFGTKVSNLVWELTNPNDLDKSKKAQYLLDKMNTMSSDALIIKLCDRLNNVSDFKTAPQGFVKKYAPETKFIIDGLEELERPLNNVQKKLIQNIKDIIENF